MADYTNGVGYLTADNLVSDTPPLPSELQVGERN